MTTPPAELDTAQRLQALFPKLFAAQNAPKPVKLQLHVDIQARAPGEFTKAQLSAYFRKLTNSFAYLKALSQGGPRFDLDGEVAGEVSEEHRKLAQEEVKRRRALRQEKIAQTQAQERTKAREEAQRKYLADKALVDLYRSFQANKLSEANFCALKGISAETLSAQLAAGQALAAQFPERPSHAERRPSGQRQRGNKGAAPASSDPRRASKP